MSLEKRDVLFDACNERIAKEVSLDQKLSLAIEFMKEALSNGRKARFRDFWRMKKVCLDLFKGDLHKTKRNAYWQEYTVLLSQAHALQRILEEETAFQAEQIALAVDGLEQRLQEQESGTQEGCGLLDKLDPTGNLFKLQTQSMFYQTLREQALTYRKEILALEIRVSQKNKMLSRLSQVCDKIFPKRKELFVELTECLSQIVDQFLSSHFDLQNQKLITQMPYSKLKEQVKCFQAALRNLCIFNDVYQKVRSALGQSWAILVQQEKEGRKSFSAKKAEPPKAPHKSDKVTLAIEKLKLLREKAKDLQAEELSKQLVEIISFVGSLENWDSERIALEYNRQMVWQLILDKRVAEEKWEFQDAVDSQKGLKLLLEKMKSARAGCGLDIEYALKLDEWMEESRQMLFAVEGKF